MHWLALSVLSAVLLGLYDVAKKTSLEQNAVLPVLFACSLVGAALILPAEVLTLTAPATAARLDVYVRPLSPMGHVYVLAKAALVTLSWVLTFFAIKNLPISLASPIRASAPLFVLLGAVVFLGEKPTSRQWTGIGCVAVSYFAFSVIGRAEGIVFRTSRWVWMLFAGTLVGAVSGLYDKFLLQAAHLAPMSVQFYFAVYNAVVQGLLLGVFWWPHRAELTRFRWRWSIAAVGLLLLLADNVYFRALAQPGALISLVSMIRRSNVVVAFALGALLFRERNMRQKAGALAGVLVGVALLFR